MWESFHANLGRVKEGVTSTINYKYTGKVDDSFIEKFEVSCGCTTPVFNPATGYLTATFKAGTVPKHLEYQGEYTSTKKIIAYTTDGKVTFTFKATIYR